MNKKNYIDKIELILNTSSKYITRKEKDMILDYVNYFKIKNNVIEDKNIELVIEIERLNNIIKEVREYADKYNDKIQKDIYEILDKTKYINSLIRKDFIETLGLNEEITPDELLIKWLEYKKENNIK